MNDDEFTSKQCFMLVLVELERCCGSYKLDLVECLDEFEKSNYDGKKSYFDSSLKSLVNCYNQRLKLHENDLIENQNQLEKFCKFSSWMDWFWFLLLACSLGFNVFLYRFYIGCM